MTNSTLYDRCAAILQRLCVEIPDRSVGSTGNRQATQFFAAEIAALGWRVESRPFDALDWEAGRASLSAGGQAFAVLPSPYALGCDVRGPLLAIASLEQLAAADLRGKIVLLHGEIAAEQIMPKNFVFYNPEPHQRIVALLEEGGPLALVCATGRNASLAGGAYPFPLFEDGDFDIPSVYMTEEEGLRLLPLAGQEAVLRSSARRIPSTGYQVMASRGPSGGGDRIPPTPLSKGGKEGDSSTTLVKGGEEGVSPTSLANEAEERISPTPLGKGGKEGGEERGGGRVVVTAHIDAKKGTPGALDNAGGAAVLLLLAGLLGDDLAVEVEIAPFNGEDYYAVPGQMLYLRENQERFDQILLDINIDGAGYHEGPSAYSFYGLPAELEAQARAAFSGFNGLVEGPQWPQGDHSIFVQFGRPAIAITSAWFSGNIDSQQITHTPADRIEILDPHKLVEVAQALALLIRHYR